MNMEMIEEKNMGIGKWFKEKISAPIKDKWDTLSGEKTLRTTKEYLDAAVGRIENLEKGYDFLRQNAVIRDDFNSLTKRLRVLAAIAVSSLVLALFSTAGTVYLFLHQSAR